DEIETRLDFKRVLFRSSWLTRPAKIRTLTGVGCLRSNRDTSESLSSPPRRLAGTSRCPQGARAELPCTRHSGALSHRSPKSRFQIGRASCRDAVYVVDV